MKIVQIHFSLSEDEININTNQISNLISNNDSSIFVWNNSVRITIRVDKLICNQTVSTSVSIWIVTEKKLTNFQNYNSVKNNFEMPETEEEKQTRYEEYRKNPDNYKHLVYYNKWVRKNSILTIVERMNDGLFQNELW